jgi:hypothetical protein
MSESNSTTVEIDNQQLRYYEELEKHINASSKNFREKSVIKQNFYDNIIKCLLSPNRKPSGSFPTKFIYWVKKHFVITKIAAIDIACCIKTKKSISVYESYYKVIGEAHAIVSHGEGEGENSILSLVKF